SLGVIERGEKRPIKELEALFYKLETIFLKPDFDKSEIVISLKEFLPNFEHEEKGKNLDQKM
ncbi:MAG TPA: nucleoside-diphosphate sugar epimerase, partial [Candidatus Butyricimonas faecavium]|nr:nucleoside-diphosphate sugar epimerase [Candidatus Butyricimonas faecavium]